jgi:hypothetical protein
VIYAIDQTQYDRYYIERRVSDTVFTSMTDARKYIRCNLQSEPFSRIRKYTKINIDDRVLYGINSIYSKTKDPDNAMRLVYIFELPMSEILLLPGELKINTSLHTHEKCEDHYIADVTKDRISDRIVSTYHHLENASSYTIKVLANGFHINTNDCVSMLADVLADTN